MKEKVHTSYFFYFTMHFVSVDNMIEAAAKHASLANKTFLFHQMV